MSERDEAIQKAVGLVADLKASDALQSSFFEYPWEHLGDAWRDVEVLIAGLDALATKRRPATDAPFPHPEFGQESARPVRAALQAAVNEVEALRLMSYTGGQPDLREEDVRGIRDLIIDLTLLLAERTGEPLPEAEMIL